MPIASTYTLPGVEGQDIAAVSMRSAANAYDFG
jgi:hypothetical protein